MSPLCVFRMWKPQIFPSTTRSCGISSTKVSFSFIRPWYVDSSTFSARSQQEEGWSGHLYPLDNVEIRSSHGRNNKTNQYPVGRGWKSIISASSIANTHRASCGVGHRHCAHVRWNTREQPQGCKSMDSWPTPSLYFCFPPRTHKSTGVLFLPFLF